jgi:hypothetical protein
MGIRLQSIFKDDEGLQWTINIHDDTYSGTVIPFTLGGDGFVLNYEGETDTRYKPVIGSYVEFTLYEQNEDHRDFLDELVTDPEGRYLVEIRVAPSPADKLFWAGVLLADQLLFDDAAWPTPCRLRATDDLANLADVLFNNNGVAYVGSDGQTFIDHICLGLTKVRQASLWGTDDVFIRAVASYTPGNIYGSGDYYNNLRTSHMTFWNIDPDNGANRYFSTLYVLEQFCIAMGARLYQANGSFWFVPVHKAIDSATVAALNYKKSSVYIDTTNIDTEIELDVEVRKLQGWQWGYQTPLKKVERPYLYRGTDVVLAYNFLKSELGNTISTDPEFIFRNTTDFLLRVGGTWVPDSDGPTLNNGSSSAIYPMRRQWSVRLKVGDYYAHRPVNWDTIGTINYFNGAATQAITYRIPSYEPITWSTNSANRVQVVGFSQWQEYSVQPFQLHEVSLPALPADSQGVELLVTLKIVDIQGLEIAGQYTATEPVTVIQVLNEDNEGDSVLYRAESSNANTVTYRQEACLLGDVAENNNYGLIQVKDTASTWAEVTTWTSPTLTTGTNDIHALGVRDILFGQSTPRLRQLGTVYCNTANVVPLMYHTLSYDGKRYALYTMGFQARARLAQLEMYELFASSAGTTVAQEDPVRRDGGLNLGGIIGVAASVRSLEQGVLDGQSAGGVVDERVPLRDGIVSLVADLDNFVSVGDTTFEVNVGTVKIMEADDVSATFNVPVTINLQGETFAVQNAGMPDPLSINTDTATFAVEVQIESFGDSTGGRLKLAEGRENGTNTIGLIAPNALSTSVEFILPSADGSNGDVLETNGSGVLSFADFGDKVENAISNAVLSTVDAQGAITSETGFEAKTNAYIKFFELGSNGTNNITIKAPTALGGNTTYILPATDGTSGQSLKTDGAGNLYWG